jgi:hypothetical protein
MPRADEIRAIVSRRKMLGRRMLDTLTPTTTSTSTATSTAEVVPAPEVEEDDTIDTTSSNPRIHKFLLLFVMIVIIMLIVFVVGWAMNLVRMLGTVSDKFFDNVDDPSMVEDYADTVNDPVDAY